MKITYQPTGINNFHNSNPINLVISGEKPRGIAGLFTASATGRRSKSKKHFCGVADCRCAHGAVEQLNEGGTEYGIRLGYCFNSGYGA